MDEMYDNKTTNNVDERQKLIEQKIDAIYKSVEKTRKYFLWTLILTVAVFVLPLIGMLFVLPSLFSTLSVYTDPSALEGL